MVITNTNNGSNSCRTSGRTLKLYVSFALTFSGNGSNGEGDGNKNSLWCYFEIIMDLNLHLCASLISDVGRKRMVILWS